ncbi:hypothetical protein GTCCBUS3UF5_22540 [Geobacillus thermoleovorans CCB_US3_UF5]|uniref:Uncharacterized protein n=2 Tax=Geobacillus TaxID=129337 RepID=A0A7U9JBX1_GEOTM|nr:hypothetical protein GTCCBUS3UF5_22540 [Geobacillus thermoleovorans CCB_US3_UF5]EQB94937.1 hypothetical protein GA8_14350 [Geobacillus sp. A8]ESU72725.1 hypothetical protein T260_06765 [Geobacillus sp. MAS1]
MRNPIVEPYFLFNHHPSTAFPRKEQKDFFTPTANGTERGKNERGMGNGE